jgi:hypothetical protein
VTLPGTRTIGSNGTIQRSLFYGNAITMLIKCDARQNISIHHNVFTRNGERNPQIKGDVRNLDFVNNAYIDPAAAIELLTGPGGGSNAGTYIGGNYCLPASNCPASPKATPSTIPAAYAVTTLATDQLKSQLLPYVGSPNRTQLDQQRIDGVAAVLPGDSPSPPASPKGLRIVG